MRIWHQDLIPKLCQKHLCAVWREGLGCYSIITQDKKGYRNHPAVKEFEYSQGDLWERLKLIREEMLRRGYHPKPMPDIITNGRSYKTPVPWQTLDEQIEVLRAKGCKCAV